MSVDNLMSSCYSITTPYTTRASVRTTIVALRSSLHRLPSGHFSKILPFRFITESKKANFSLSENFHVITNCNKLHWSFIGQFYYCLQRGNVADYSSVTERVQWVKELPSPHLIANWPKTSLNILAGTTVFYQEISPSHWLRLVFIRPWV